MKKGLKSLVLLAAFSFGFSACSHVLSYAARESKDWEFVQSVGGLKLGSPYRDSKGHVLLPIICDVSGTKKITKQPTTLNSALACDTPSVIKRRCTILIAVRTTIASELHPNAACSPADLGVIQPGTYFVDYLGPKGARNNLGSIVIPKL